MSDAAVLVVGDVITDIIVRPEGPLRHGSDTRATIRARPGGAAANQAAWLAACGARVKFAARVGAADRDAQAAHLRRLGVEPCLAADPQAPSGILISIVDADGERSFLTDRGANLNLAPADLPPALLDGVGLLAVSGYSLFAPGPRAAVLGLMAAARARGLATALDAASVGFLDEVGAAAFLGWAAATTLLFANADEALALAGTPDLDGQMRRLGETATHVVVKRGADGAALGGRDGLRLALPAPATQVLDTTGAGDAFAAAFLAAFLRGENEAACLTSAIATGAAATTRLGGQPAFQQSTGE